MNGRTQAASDRFLFIDAMLRARRFQEAKSILDSMPHQDELAVVERRADLYWRELDIEPEREAERLWKGREINELEQFLVRLENAPGDQKRTRAIVLLYRSRILIHREQYTEALRSLDEYFREHADAPADPLLRARLLLEAAFASHRDRQFSRASHFALQAESLFEQQGDDEGRADCQTFRALLCKVGSDWGLAEQLLQGAMGTYARLNLSSKLLTAQLNLGNVLVFRGKFRDARGPLEAAHQIARLLGVPQRIVRVLSNLGLLAARETRFEESEAYLHESVALSKQHNLHRSELLAMEYLGELNLLRGDLPKARAILETVIVKAAGIERDVESECRGRLAEVALGSGSLEEALSLIGLASAEFESGQDEYELGVCRSIHGETLLRQGEIAQGLERLREAAEFFEAMGELHYSPRVRSLLDATSNGRPFPSFFELRGISRSFDAARWHALLDRESVGLLTPAEHAEFQELASAAEELDKSSETQGLTDELLERHSQVQASIAKVTELLASMPRSN